MGACYSLFMANDESKDYGAASPRPRLARRIRILTGALAGGLAVALLLAGGLWLWARQRLDEQARECTTRLAQAVEGSSAWASALAAGEAEAVFRAYQAGIHAAVLAGRRESLDVSIDEMVRLPGVVFVHIMGPDGAVLASSDRRYTVTGRASERAAWALGAIEASVRQGALPGTIELAIPIQDAAGARAVLWGAYNTQKIIERSRPKALTP